LQTSSTAGCSTDDVITCLLVGLALTAPKMAVLLLSVAHDVNRTCFEPPAFKKRATVLRALAMASAAGREASYMELGLKYSLVR